MEPTELANDLGTIILIFLVVCTVLYFNKDDSNGL